MPEKEFPFEKQEEIQCDSDINKQLERARKTLNVLERELATGNIEEDTLEEHLSTLIVDLHDFNTQGFSDESLSMVVQFVQNISSESTKVDRVFTKVCSRYSPFVIDKVGFEPVKK